jgi:tRNA-2-methylthio-N6-dimethylallyladenosine synthase
VLGCMAERLKEKFLEHKYVDLVAGPDAYRDLPRLIKILESKTETSGE